MMARSCWRASTDLRGSLSGIYLSVPKRVDSTLVGLDYLDRLFVVKAEFDDFCSFLSCS